MQNKVLIKEIFTSIQGEGPYIGYNQLFIRFSQCNLHCRYCDTDFKINLKEYTPESLADEILKKENIHSVSLTGGEPLIEADFLVAFLPLIDKKVYLETNGTLYENLKKVINYVDIISMDIKLESASECGNLFNAHEKFIKVAVENNKEIFVKIVFDENISDSEIEKVTDLAEKYSVGLILQPKMDGEILNISSSVIMEVFNKFNTRYKNVRLIPQVHKFINVQ